ncbi:MAG: sugar ABC transporter permease [Clostridia bacterium]|nr:sugar ABC transporter permease [Clostridia bacterium]
MANEPYENDQVVNDVEQPVSQPEAQPQLQEVYTTQEALSHPQTKQLKKLRYFDLSTRRNFMGYWFILPFAIGFLLIYLPALIEAFRFSTHDIITSSGTMYTLETNKEGLWYYYNTALVKDPDFIRGIWESMASMLLNVVIIIIYSLLMATILNRNIAGKSFYRAMLFLPVIVATGIIATAENFEVTTNMVQDIEAASAGASGSIFNEFGIEQLMMSLNINDTLSGIVIAAIGNLYGIITCSGVQLIIFLAGLQSISPSIYESATVEGATWWESFWKITIPMISPLILVNTVYTIVDSFTQYGNQVMDEIYKLISENASYSDAAARSFVYLAVVGVLIAIVVPVVNKFVFYENK